MGSLNGKFYTVMNYGASTLFGVRNNCDRRIFVQVSSEVISSIQDPPCIVAFIRQVHSYSQECLGQVGIGQVAIVDSLVPADLGKTKLVLVIGVWTIRRQLHSHNVVYIVKP